MSNEYVKNTITQHETVFRIPEYVHIWSGRSLLWFQYH